jgi:hypothetical protein
LEEIITLVGYVRDESELPCYGKKGDESAFSGGRRASLSQGGKTLGERNLKEGSEIKPAWKESRNRVRRKKEDCNPKSQFRTGIFSWTWFCYPAQTRLKLPEGKRTEL